MGGLGRIYYRALSLYAGDHGICGSAFVVFVTFVRAMDEEFIAWMNEKQKRETDKGEE